MRSSRNDTLFMTTVRQDICGYINNSPRIEFNINRLSKETGISRSLALDVIMREHLLVKDYKTRKYYKIIKEK